MTVDQISYLTAQDLPRLDAALDELTNFANAYPGCDVWGTPARLAEIRDGVLRPMVDLRACSSMLKLRSAMFFVARAARFTDETDGPFGTPREATGEDGLRDVLALMHLAVMRAQREDHRVIESVVRVAQSIPVDGAFHERDFRDRIWKTLEKLYTPPNAEHVYAGTEQSLGPLSAWAPDDPPGRFDLGLSYESGGEVEKYRILAEVKWSDRNTVSHSIWDAAKPSPRSWLAPITSTSSAAGLGRSGPKPPRRLSTATGPWPSDSRTRPRRRCRDRGQPSRRLARKRSSTSILDTGRPQSHQAIAGVSSRSERIAARAGPIFGRSVDFAMPTGQLGHGAPSDASALI